MQSELEKQREPRPAASSSSPSIFIPSIFIPSKQEQAEGYRTQ